MIVDGGLRWPVDCISQRVVSGIRFLWLNDVHFGYYLQYGQNHMSGIRVGEMLTHAR